MIGQELKYSAAEKAARRNRQVNRDALAGRQPRLVHDLDQSQVTVEWVFARDGSLTALDAEGNWWAGSSLPRRTAEALLKKMDVKSPVACFLSPTHAGQVREALNRLSAGQALVVIVPEACDVRLMLACEPFESEIRAGRLWFAWGSRWEDELRELLTANDGLAIPGQFLRTGLVEDEAIQDLIRRAQGVFARETARRAEVVKSLLAQPTGERICVVAPGRFRLWDDAGGVLADLAGEAGWAVLNPDEPCSTSAVALARAVAGCRALVTANAGRLDFPGGLPDATRVVSWNTGGRIPRYDGRCIADTLLVADARWREAALRAGWPDGRVRVAGWPRAALAGSGTGLGVIADTRPIEMPSFELSSQRVLWEMIADELTRDPFAVGGDVGAYLFARAGRVAVEERTIDVACFVERLIVPAYQQGLARWLIEGGIPVKLFGRGWDAIGEFAPFHNGEVPDRTALARAAGACAALVDVWPGGAVHPVEATGRPVVRRGGFGRQQWLSEARRLAAGESRAVGDAGPVLTSELIRALV